MIPSKIVSAAFVSVVTLFCLGLASEECTGGSRELCTQPATDAVVDLVRKVHLQIEDKSGAYFGSLLAVKYRVQSSGSRSKYIVLVRATDESGNELFLHVKLVKPNNGHEDPEVLRVRSNVSRDTPLGAF